MLTLIAITFLFGTFIGSFLNVCVHRLPRNESVVQPPSRCYSCGTHLPWHDNLPIIGWLLLRGRCRACGTSFSVRYLFAEVAVGALTAATAAWLYSNGTPWVQQPWVQQMTEMRVFSPEVLTATIAAWQYFNGTDWAPQLAFGAAFAALLVLVWNLYVSSLIDLDHYIIPDELTKSFQLIAPFLAVFAATGLGIEIPLPASWLISVDAFGVATPTSMNLLKWMGVIVGIAVGVLALSIPVARVIYSTFTKEAPWTDEDHRGFRVGVWWFILCTMVHLIALAGLLIFQPGGWWLLASLLLAQAILGSLAGWFSLYLVGFFGTIAFRKNAMGFGDVKFLAPIGAFLGPVGVLYAFFAAAIVGTIVGIPMLLLRSTRVVPFGPYLALGALLALVVGGRLHQQLFTGIF